MLSLMISIILHQDQEVAIWFKWGTLSPCLGK